MAVIIQPISPDCSSLGLRHTSVYVDAATDLIEYVEILNKGISTGSDSAIVRDVDSVIEVGQVSVWPFHRHDVPVI